MTFDQLVTLISIEESGSFKAAAEFLHKTQPSLSMAIKKLEEEFDITLFDRNGYRPKLTQQGQHFLRQSKKVMAEFMALEKLAKEMSQGLESEIHICADAIFPICEISPILKTFFEPQMTTQLNLSTDVLEGVIKKVLDHEVDFALGPDLETDQQIESIKIHQTDILPVISTEHFTNNEVNFEYLKKLPQVVVESSATEYRGQVHGGISDQFWYTTDFSMKKQLIKSGLGWGRLPKHQITHELRHNELSEITNIPELAARSVPMFLMRSRTKVSGPNAKKLWNFLKEKSL